MTELPEGVERLRASGFARMVPVTLSRTERNHPDTFIRYRDLPVILAQERERWEAERRKPNPGKWPRRMLICRNCSQIVNPGTHGGKCPTEHPRRFQEHDRIEIELVPAAELDQTKAPLEAEIERLNRELRYEQERLNRELRYEEQQCRAVRSALVKAVDDSRQFTWEEIEQLAKPELVGDGEWAPAFIELEISAETLIAARSAPLLQVTIGERSAELPVTSIDRAPEGAERRVDFEDHGAHKESA